MLGLGAGDPTPATTQAACLGGVVDSFAVAAEEFLPRLAGLKLSEATVPRTTETMACAAQPSAVACKSLAYARS